MLKNIVVIEMEPSRSGSGVAGRERQGWENGRERGRVGGGELLSGLVGRKPAASDMFIAIRQNLVSMGLRVIRLEHGMRPLGREDLDCYIDHQISVFSSSYSIF